MSDKLSSSYARLTQGSAVDKTGWPEGPWMEEPDDVEWAHMGLKCWVIRQRGGHLCGYVGLPEDHPYYGLNYRDIFLNAQVHGGLTYSGELSSCGRWWFGFDCGHTWDYLPSRAYSRFSGVTEQEYRTVEYVTDETTSLAEQLYFII